MPPCSSQATQSPSQHCLFAVLFDAGTPTQRTTPTNSCQTCMKPWRHDVPNVSTSRTDGSMGYAYDHICLLLLLSYFINYSSVCAYSMKRYKRSELMNINNNFYQKLHKGTLTHTRPYPRTTSNTHTRLSYLQRLLWTTHCVPHNVQCF